MATVEFGAHLDRITGLDFDASHNRLVTAADDRTLRVWDARNGRLLKTIWVPRNQRKDGELYALAVHPGNGTAVVGGWTGYDWDGAMSIYLVDLERGEIQGRIQGFEERIASLEYSDDGSILAVALLNGRVLTLSVPGYEPRAESRLCATTAYRVDFGPDNRLVANCFDGKVRVYDDKLRLQAEREILPDKQPGAVRFSPDGRLIAIGFFDSPEVHVLDARDLEPMFKPDTGTAADSALFAVEWSLDGQSLYAAGDLTRNGRYRILRWDESGRGVPVELDAATKRMLRLKALPGGALAYTSMEHGVVVLEAGGVRRFEAAPSIVNHQWRQNLLRVSRDGSVVGFGLDPEGKRFAVFSLSDRHLGITDQPEPELRAPIVEHPRFKVTDWHRSYAPRFNDRPIELHGQQESHSLAIEKNGEFFIMGLDSELRAYEADGSLRWSVYPSSGPYTANLSGDGRLVVAGHQDGTIRWYRSEDGAEVLTLFPHDNGEDWVAWTPTGHFVSSPNGDRYIGWHLNNGPDRAADFYSAWQFERLLYRPDLVDAWFSHRGVLPEADGEAFDVSELRDSAPPAVEISVRDNGGGEATIEVAATKHKRPIAEYTVYVNSIPVTPFSERVLSGDEQDHFQRRHTVPLFSTENEIRVEVFTDRSIEVARTFVDLPAAATLDARRGDLYILSIGVNELTYMPQNSLDYAAQDAVVVARELTQNEDKLFNGVYTRVLSDLGGELPIRDNIVQSLDFLRQAGPNDTVMLFLASHGLSNAAGDYFMVPRDARPEELTLLLKGAENDRRFDSLVRWDTFFEALRAASGRRLLMVDSCQARKIEGNFDSGSLAKRSAAASFALLAASKGDESSQEYPPGGHGLFTYALLEALDESADDDRNGFVELNEMFGHARTFVELNRVEKRITQTPQLVAPPSLIEMPIATVRRRN